MYEIRQTEVMYFIHHFPTHSTIWEVHETDGYASIGDAESVYSGAFEGADSKVYMSYEPIMMRRERAEEYVKVPNNEFIRYSVIEIK